MKISNREKRDWSLLIVIVPIGIFLMMIAGQIAVRIVPNWSVDAGMQSSLNLDTASRLNAGLIQPILPEILTPVSWFDTFLTPGANSNVNVVFPPFIVFDPSATPSPTTSPTSAVTPTPPVVTATPSPTSNVTPTATATKKPDDDPPPPPGVCTDGAANNNGGSLPCTYNVPVSSTPEGTLLTPIPGGLVVGTPDGSVAGIPDGRYVVLDLGSTPIIVNGPSETNYDFVYYERATGSGLTRGIDMDQVILSISMDNFIYYVVFNWGDGNPDNNSNVGNVTTNTGTEDDNQHINAAPTQLYGSSPDQTGILIDVDNAPSNPPPGSYQWMAIQAPSPTTGNDGADRDSIEVTEVPP